MNEYMSASDAGDRIDPFTRALLDDAKRFDQHALDKAERMQKRMMILVVVMSAVAAIAVLAAVIQAMDQREVQPFVLLKDETTGSVTEVVRVEPQQWSHGDAFDMANVAAYVRAREEYSDATVVHNYETVELMSMPPVMQGYQNWLDPEANKLSPMALYPQGIVDVEVTGIVRVGRGAAQAHFVRTVRGVSSPPRPSTWIANVEFEYVAKNMTVGARLRNPLGFTVRSYSVDEVVVRNTTDRASGAGAAQ